MPDNIKFQDFGAGWIPSDDEIRGRKNGFLQFDNVDLDKNGAVVMAGGTKTVGSPYAYDLHTLFSTFIGGNRKDYSCDTNGQILRGNTVIASGGHNSVGCFGSAFNYVLACSGNTRIKDNGTVTYNLGITPSNFAPLITVNAINAPRISFASVITDIVTPAGLGSHSVIGSYVQMNANDNGDATGDAVLQTYDATPAIYNLNNLTGIGSDNTGTATDNDYIILAGYLMNPWGKSLQFDVLLVNGNAAGTIVPDYYRYVIDDLAREAEFASDGSFTVRMRRSGFERIGSTSADWSTVYGFRITFHGDALEVINILGTSLGTPSFAMTGGSKTQQGTYEYMQINVRNDGSYVGKSPMSPASNAVTIDMMQAFIQPRVPSSIDPQATEAWIYRRGGLLEKWYLVKVFNASTGFSGAYDTFSDADALTFNVPHNDRLISIAASAMNEKIHAIIGPVQGRWYYFSDSVMFPSDINTPDLIDPRLAVRLTSSDNEIFLWAFQVGERQILIGTSNDIYLMSGTFITQPDFSVDLYYSGFGCEYPPIVKDATEAANGVFYLAKDGWRLVSSDGETISLVSPSLDRLYKGTNCYGYPAPNLKIMPGHTARFPVVVGRNKLWCCMTGTGRIEVYDFTRKYWRVLKYRLGSFILDDIGAAYSTQDGQILCYFEKDRRLREIDIPETKYVDGLLRNEINLLSPVLDNDTPRQRKDSYTLTLHVFTSLGGALNVSNIDNEGFETLLSTNVTSASKTTDRHLDLSPFYPAPDHLIKSYQLKLKGEMDDFLLDGAEITFDTRPLPVSFLRVLSQNFGASSYKRLSSIPFQIDTRGYTINVVCLVDNIAQNPMVVLSNYKKSFNYTYPMHDINEITRGRDYEFIFSAGASQGLFEFYGFQSPQQADIEILPEQKIAHVLAPSNFGTANKKRIRVWPFVINPLGGNVTFAPLVDCANTSASIFSGDCKRTFFHFFKTDVFGVDYGGSFSSSTPFEFYGAVNPDIVQVLPIARQFDQVGPLEMFKYGKVKQIELRVMAFRSGFTHSDLPFNIYFNDNTIYSGVFEIEMAKEASYFLGVPKGTNGSIVRIELGPTEFDFHRFYIRLQAFQSGRDTEGEWLSLSSLGQ